MRRDDTPIVSYAQNREDVLLWRAFRDIPPAEGFWIDIGANDPVADSVTKMFSLRGWRGINVEPVTARYQALVRDRPNEINVHAAAGKAVGELTLHRIAENDGLSTFDEPLAQMYRDRGMTIVDEVVPVTTIPELWQRHVRGTVHFLKIDVEGHETAVVEGADWRRHRPLVVMLEATYPERWRPILEANGYRFVLDDGLNLVFVVEERPDLVTLLSRPVVTVLEPHILFHDHKAQHDEFLRHIGAKGLTGELLAAAGLGDGEGSDALARAAHAVAVVACRRPDLTKAFARDHSVDCAQLLRWVLDTPIELDGDLRRLDRHRDALEQLRSTIDPGGARASRPPQGTRAGFDPLRAIRRMFR